MNTEVKWKDKFVTLSQNKLTITIDPALSILITKRILHQKLHKLALSCFSFTVFQGISDKRL